MKKLKKLRVLLVAAFIINSLFFLNCYAMEKKPEAADENNFVQEEYDVNEEEDKKRKDIESKSNIVVSRYGDIDLTKENKNLKKTILVLANICNKFEEKYKNLNRMLNRLLGEDKEFLFKKFEDLTKLVEMKKKELAMLEDRVKNLKLFYERNYLQKENEKLKKKIIYYKHLSRIHGILRKVFEIAIRKGQELEGMVYDLEKLLKEKESIISDKSKEINKLINIVCSFNGEREGFKKEKTDLEEELRKERFRNLYLKTLNKNVTAENKIHKFEERVFGSLFSNFNDLIGKFKKNEVDKLILKNLLEENIKLRMENEILKGEDVEKKINEIKLALKNKKPKLEFENLNIDRILNKINLENNDE